MVRTTRGNMSSQINFNILTKNLNYKKKSEAVFVIVR